jgi:hypothetical protein
MRSRIVHEAGPPEAHPRARRSPSLIGIDQSSPDLFAGDHWAWPSRYPKVETPFRADKFSEAAILTIADDDAAFPAQPHPLSRKQREVAPIVATQSYYWAGGINGVRAESG